MSPHTIGLDRHDTIPSMPKLTCCGALGCAMGILISFLGIWLTDGFTACGAACEGAWRLVLAGLVFFLVGAVMLLVAVFISAVHKLRDSAASL